MPSVRRLHRATFADAVATLDPDEFAAFVEGLYRERGWIVERHGTDLRMRRGQGDTAPRTVRAVTSTGEPTDQGDVDRVVAASDSIADRVAPGSAVSRPDDLYDLLLYGIEREAADALCRNHLGRSVEAAPGEEPASVPGPSDGGGEAGATGADSSAQRQPDDATANTAVRGSSRPSRRLLVGVVALLVLVAVGAAASGGFGGEPSIGRDSGADTGAIDPPATPSAPAPTDGGAPSSTPAERRSATAPSHAESRGGVSASERRYVQLTPTCARPPGLVAVIVVGALRNNDPDTEDGIRTAWYFSSHSSVGSTYPNFARFVTRERFEPLHSHRRVEYARAYREDGVAAYRVTVIDEAGRGHTYLMAFSNEADGNRRGSISNGGDGDREACWRLAGILPE